MKRNYLILFGLMLIFILTGYFLFFYTPTKNINIIPNIKKVNPSSKKVSQNESVKKIENNENNENNEANLTIKKTAVIESPKGKNQNNNAFEFVENITNTKNKVSVILNQLIPNSGKYRKIDESKFNELMVFAFNNFNEILPNDKNSNAFIDICNLKNELFHQLQKSQISFNPKTIDDICL